MYLCRAVWWCFGYGDGNVWDAGGGWLHSLPLSTPPSPHHHAHIAACRSPPLRQLVVTASQRVISLHSHSSQSVEMLNIVRQANDHYGQLRACHRVQWQHEAWRSCHLQATGQCPDYITDRALTRQLVYMARVALTLSIKLFPLIPILVVYIIHVEKKKLVQYEE